MLATPSRLTADPALDDPSMSAALDSLEAQYHVMHEVMNGLQASQKRLLPAAAESWQAFASGLAAALAAAAGPVFRPCATARSLAAYALRARCCWCFGVGWRTRSGQRLGCAQ